MSVANRTTGSLAFHALVNNIPGMPRVAFDKPNEGGAPETTDDNANAEAEAAAAAAAEAEAEAAAAALAEAEEAAAAAEAEGKDAKTLADEKLKLVREVMDKKNKLKAAEKKAADAAAALAAYDGIDPARAKELLKKEADAEKAAAEARGDFERVKTMMAEEHEKQVKTYKDQIEALRGQVTVSNQTINNLTIGNDFGSSTFIREKLTLTPAKARALYGAHFEVVEGRTVGYDKPAGQPNRTELVDASGKSLAFDEAFKRIIDADPDKETLLKAKTKVGSGSITSETKTGEDPDKSGLFGKSRIAAGLKDFQ